MNPFRASPADPLRPRGDDKHQVEYVRDEREYDREAFNRVAYTSQLLRFLKVKRRVAICVGSEKLHVEQGGLPGFPGKSPWAVLSIPPDASRAHIALTVAQLAGRARDPFLLDLMLRLRPT